MLYVEKQGSYRSDSQTGLREADFRSCLHFLLIPFYRNWLQFSVLTVKLGEYRQTTSNMISDSMETQDRNRNTTFMSGVFLRPLKIY